MRLATGFWSFLASSAAAALSSPAVSCARSGAASASELTSAAASLRRLVRLMFVSSLQDAVACINLVSRIIVVAEESFYARHAGLALFFFQDHRQLDDEEELVACFLCRRYGPLHERRRCLV